MKIKTKKIINAMCYSFAVLGMLALVAVLSMKEIYDIQVTDTPESIANQVGNFRFIKIEGALICCAFLLVIGLVYYFVNKKKKIALI